MHMWPKLIGFNVKEWLKLGGDIIRDYVKGIGEGKYGCYHHISLYICEKLSRKMNKLLKLKEIVRRMCYKKAELNFFSNGWIPHN